MKSYMILTIVILVCLILLVQSCNYRSTPIIDFFEQWRHDRQEQREDREPWWERFRDRQQDESKDEDTVDPDPYQRKRFFKRFWRRRSYVSTSF